MRQPKLSIEDLRRRTSDLRGIADVRLVTLEDGPGRGQRLLQLRNGAGVEVEIAVDRGFDLATLRVRGVNLGWNSPVGLRTPSFPGDLEHGLGPLRSFDGFLVTCGLDHYGKPAEGPAHHFAYGLRNTVTYPLHGRVSAQPATIRGYGIRDDSSPAVWCEGEVRQAAVFGEVLVLTRRVEIPLFEGRITLTDTVTNRGFRPTRHAMLYHFNVGFPFLDETSELTGQFGTLQDAFKSEPRIPRDDAQEKVDVVHPEADSRGLVTVGMRNPALDGGLSLQIQVHKAQLPTVALWQCWQSGLYVVGIEPCTPLPDNLDVNGDDSSAFLPASSTRRYDIAITVPAG
jgi:hypothetical protein